MIPQGVRGAAIVADLDEHDEVGCLENAAAANNSVRQNGTFALVDDGLEDSDPSDDVG